MKVSIVTPSYNQGKYIKDCIDSVRNQTYRPIEHIIVDNCSIDETRKILEDYQKNPKGVEVKIIIEPDKGQSDALNKGFKMASGDIIGWLNADEFYLPNAVRIVIEKAQKFSHYDVFYGDSIFVNEQGKFLRYRACHKFNYNILLYYGPFISTCSFFMRRNVVNEGFLLDIEYDLAMDHEYFLKLANKNKKFFQITKAIGVFRMHSTNKSLQLLTDQSRSEFFSKQRYNVLFSKSLIGTKILFRIFRVKRFIIMSFGMDIFRELIMNIKFKHKKN